MVFFGVSSRIRNPRRPNEGQIKLSDRNISMHSARRDLAVQLARRYDYFLRSYSIWPYYLQNKIGQTDHSQKREPSVPSSTTSPIRKYPLCSPSPKATGRMLKPHTATSETPPTWPAGGNSPRLASKPTDSCWMSRQTFFAPFEERETCSL